MKKMKQVLSIFLAVLIIMLTVPAVFSTNIIESGTCGDHLTWTLDNDGEVTISGTGNMWNYERDQDPSPYATSTVSPWNSRSDIKSVIIENGVTNVGESAFYSCKNLTNITIANSVLTIERNAFAFCEKLTSVTIPGNVTRIGNFSFLSCLSLATVTLKEGVKEIGTQAFAYCGALSQVSFPDSLESIESTAFYYCSNLKTISLPSSITHLGSAFEGTGYYNDESNWDNDVLYAGCYLLQSKESIAGECVIKEGTRLIADAAFRWSSNLTSVVVPGSITVIPNGCFANCDKLQSVVLSKEITTIESAAFQFCYALNDIYYTGTETQWNNISILGTTMDDLWRATIHFNYDPNAHTHNYSSTITIPATCSTTGIRTFTCSCGSSYTETIPINPSTHVNTKNVAATASTCTVKGYSAGVYCNDCKKYISGHAQQPLAAHTTTLINAKDATYDADGYTGDTYCTVCKQTLAYGSVIPKLTKPEDPTDPTKPTEPTNPTTPTEPTNPTQPATQPQPSSGCAYCGGTHTGFPGILIGFFHSILALFGLRK